MTNSWLYILVVMLAGSFIIHMYPTLAFIALFIWSMAGGGRSR